MGLVVDDYELTLKELEGQRNALLLQLEVVNAGIVRFKDIVAELMGVRDGSAGKKDGGLGSV